MFLPSQHSSRRHTTYSRPAFLLNFSQALQARGGSGVHIRHSARVSLTQSFTTGEGRLEHFINYINLWLQRIVVADSRQIFAGERLSVCPVSLKLLSFCCARVGRLVQEVAAAVWIKQVTLLRKRRGGDCPDGHANRPPMPYRCGWGLWAPYLVRRTDIRTGVTYPATRRNLFQERPAVWRSAMVLEGDGQHRSSSWVRLRRLSLTNTLAVPRATDALLPGVRRRRDSVRSVNPVVGETNDGWLIIRQRVVTV
jgi:hypothetical protein